MQTTPTTYSLACLFVVGGSLACLLSGTPSLAQEQGRQIRQTPSLPGSQQCSAAARMIEDALKLSGDEEAREKKYREAIRMCPEMKEAHYNLGVLLASQGRQSEALAEFRIAEEGSKNSRFRVAVALAEYASGSRVSAQKKLRAVVDDEPKNSFALQSLANILAESKQVEEAQALYQRALDVDPNDARILYNLGVLREQKKDFSEARVFYRRATQTQGDFYEAYLRLGRLAQSLQEFEEAESAFVRAAEIRPQDSMPFRLLGACYVFQGKLDKAELAFEKAYEFDHRDMESLVNLGIIQVEKKQETLAVETLQKAITQSPEHAKAHAALGWAYLQLGRYQDAKRSLEKAQAIVPDEPLAKHHLNTLQKRLGQK